MSTYGAPFLVAPRAFEISGPSLGDTLFLESMGVLAHCFMALPFGVTCAGIVRRLSPGLQLLYVTNIKHQQPTLPKSLVPRIESNCILNSITNECETI